MLQEFIEMNEFPGDSVASKKTMAMAIAATSKSATGFDVTKNFPPGTNFEAMLRSTSGSRRTWSTFKFQVERGMLSGLHGGLQRFLSLPMPIQGIWDLAKTLLKLGDGNNSYDPFEEISLGELVHYLDPGPQRVATAIEFRRPPHIIGMRKPTTLKLASGEIERPTRAALEAYRIAKESAKAFEATFEEREASRVSTEIANLISWASQTPSVNELVIYERRGLLMDHGEELFDTINNKLEEINFSQRRKVTVRFGTQKPVTDDFDLEVIIACQTSAEINNSMTKAARLKALIGTENAPDLFIARHGSNGGFPLYALTDTVTFVQQVKCRFFARDLPLQQADWVRAIKAYYFAVHESRAAELMPERATAS